jgi:hypothetical protein
MRIAVAFFWVGIALATQSAAVFEGIGIAYGFSR